MPFPLPFPEPRPFPKRFPDPSVALPRLARRRWLALAGASLWPAWAGAVPGRVPLLAVPPLALQQRRLANGLALVLLPESGAAQAAGGGRPGSGTVSVQVWYQVGGKDDPEGRSGFAHLFEHMMFKGARHLTNEQFDRLTEDVGGANNAFTAEDVTVYHAEVPANHLERLLWAEAERMAHLNVDQANFDSERAVVKEEFRERVLADPYGRLFNGLPAAFWQQHPYRRPVIGSIEDLEAATLDDVRRFHATYYRPDNAVLIVAGDFDPAQAQAWVARYFGALARPAAPPPRVQVREPRRERSEHLRLQGPRVPLPALALMWQGPGAGHADAAALHVAAALLASGESARLNEALVYRQRIAQSAGFSADLLADGGMLVAWAIAAGEPAAAAAAAPGAVLDRLERGLRREIARLADAPIVAAELDKVRTGLVTQAIAGRQTPEGRATAVGWAIVQRGDAAAADRELAELQAVRAEDVQRVLRRYVGQGHAVRLDYSQAADPAKGPAATKEGR